MRIAQAQKYDVIEGGKRLVTLHNFDVVQQVIREIARRDAKAAAEWAVSIGEVRHA